MDGWRLRIDNGHTAQEYFASRVEVPRARHLRRCVLPPLLAFGTTCLEFDGSCGQLQVRGATKDMELTALAFGLRVLAPWSHQGPRVVYPLVLVRLSGGIAGLIWLTEDD